MSDEMWDSGFRKRPSEYSVWYEGSHAGVTTDAEAIGSWSLGKSITEMKIEKNGIEVPLGTVGWDSRLLVKYLRDFNTNIESILPGELFEL